jgi:hypothetical protein
MASRKPVKGNGPRPARKARARKPAAKKPVARQFTDAQKVAFCELAQRVGVRVARDELNYPAAYRTGYEWLNAKQIELPPALLTSMAAANRTWYGVEEKILVGQALLDAAYEQLTRREWTGEHDQHGQKIYQGPSAKDVSMLSGVFKRTVEALNLLEGRATSIHQTLEANAAPELLTLIHAARAQNARKLEVLKELPPAEDIVEADVVEDAPTGALEDLPTTVRRSSEPESGPE